MPSSLPRVSIRKMGTRGGQPHYGVICLGCPLRFGRDNVLAIGYLSREGAELAKQAHVLRHPDKGE